MTSRLEKLTISLALEVSFEDRQNVGNQGFEHPRKSGGDGDDAIFRKIVEVWPGMSVDSEFSKSDGSAVSVSEFSKRLRSGANWGGPLQANGLKLQVAVLPAMMQTIITIEETHPGSAGSWDEWVRPFLGDPSFVQAWIADVDYDYWQNASDILEYETLGRDYTHLPLKSNGLPFPLQQDIIDTSRNPGRVEIRQGYVEAVASEMWIGKRFLRSVGRSDDLQVEDDAGIVFAQVSPGVTKIYSAESCFSGSDTAGKQIRLRRSLYGHV